MSSITIEVDDPEKAYESVLELFEAAPVDFSQVTSVRLEIEYDTEEGSEDSDSQPTETDETGTTDGEPESGPSITDAEGKSLSSTFDPAPQDAADPTTDGFDEITFGEDPNDQADDDPFAESADPDDSIFGADEATETPDQSTDDSIFAASTDDTPEQSATVTDADGLNGVTFDDPAGTTRGETDTAHAESQSTQEDDQPTPSPRTYNKVMRLLQNRDFPIERTQIETVAAGAYDVDPDECRTIVDAAIEKGLVAQQGSKLVDPTE
ncbi:hypothetical protein [Haloarchaeobius sp. TZWSO28]|uniref:hypothetical protein n=1 Tax=Haloarchaeobius sp. TZWSO28 TaxID=3446119 RepID=UPI003EBA01AC